MAVHQTPQSRVFIVPTRNFFFLALVVTVQVVFAIRYNNNNFIFALAFFVAAVASISGWHGYRNLSGLGLSPTDASPVFAGGTASFEFQVVNRSKSRHCFSLALTGDCEGHGGNAAPVLFDAPPGSRGRTCIVVPAGKRGLLTLDNVKLSSTYPMGIFNMTGSYPGVSAKALVYPSPSPGQIEADAETNGTAGGGREAAPLQEDFDFDGIRKYQAGDRCNRIHWKGVAKGQGIHVKDYRNGEADRAGGGDDGGVWLDWIDLPSGSDTERRLSLLCRMALDADHAGMRYGLRLPGAETAQGRGAAHLHCCLKSLALFAHG